MSQVRNLWDSILDVTRYNMELINYDLVCYSCILLIFTFCDDTSRARVVYICQDDISNEHCITSDTSVSKVNLQEPNGEGDGAA